MWRDPQPNVASPLGRVVQAGDAAHMFLPSSGSGINQGIEDSIYLASCLQLAGKANVGWATKVLSKLRWVSFPSQRMNTILACFLLSPSLPLTAFHSMSKG